MGGHSGKQSNSDDDDDDDDDHNEKVHDHHNDNNNVGFDQLINEDSDDDVPIQTMNTSKTSSLFTTSRVKEQQYEHFQDSDDETINSTTTKSSLSKFKYENVN
jgi:hypothetical protein